MIIKGGSVSSVKFWSRHLLSTENDRAQVIEINGLSAEDLPSALKEMKAIADQSRCEGKFIYQANISPRAHEKLTDEQWLEAVDTLEKNLGLTGHQRVVIEHEKNGRTHRHIVWNRVDGETLRVASMYGNYYTHQRTARELEARFGLEVTQSLHGQKREDGRPHRPPEQWEQRAVKFGGVDPAKLKEELTAIWQAAETGKAFMAAVEERGYILAKGDRRDFCIMDRAGFVHSLARRIDGVKAKDVREKMADIDRDSLPSVEDARHMQGRDRGNRRTAKAKRKLESEDKAQDRWRFRAEAQRARAARQIRPANPGKGALLVATKGSNVAVTLLDFVGGLLDGRKDNRPKTREEKNEIDRALDARRAAESIENIRESMERGENLRPSDLTRLTDSHLENIRLQGDDYMRELVAGIQKSRDQAFDWGRTRER